MLEKLKTSSIYELILPFYNYFEVLAWLKRGKTLPTPHLLKQKLIRSLVNEFDLRTMVETGTYLGNMTSATAKVFRKIITIELDHVLYKRAKRKFKDAKHIKVIEGDSSLVIKKVLPKITAPTLFWLDAHYSGGITSKGKKESPVVSELRAILSHPVKKHVILMDDANLFTGKGGYPALSELIKKIKKHTRYSLKVVNNIVVLKPRV